MSVAVAAEFLPRVRRDEPMSRHTSWRVGGPADIFYTPRDRDELAAFLASLPVTRRCCGWAWAATCWCATAASAAS